MPKVVDKASNAVAMSAAEIVGVAETVAAVVEIVVVVITVVQEDNLNRCETC